MSVWKKVVIGSALAILLLLIMIAVFFYSNARVTVLSSLAYDHNPLYGYTVYIEESDALKPYLVLTNDYNGGGNTLLLRDEILPEVRYYNNWDLDKPSYYNGSEIDVWLNGEYRKMLGDLQVKPSKINITAEAAIGRTGKETEDIVRGVFLLSWGEVGGKDSYVFQTNGELLAYFRNKPNRLAVQEGAGRTQNWFLRSTDTWNFTGPAVVVFDGGLGSGDVSTPLGIRPAFCLSSDTAVVYQEIEDFGNVFLIQK